MYTRFVYVHLTPSNSIYFFYCILVIRFFSKFQNFQIFNLLYHVFQKIITVFLLKFCQNYLILKF
jgi:hypothetical protein